MTVSRYGGGELIIDMWERIGRSRARDIWETQEWPRLDSTWP